MRGGTVVVVVVDERRMRRFGGRVISDVGEVDLFGTRGRPSSVEGEFDRNCIALTTVLLLELREMSEKHRRRAQML